MTYAEYKKNELNKLENRSRKIYRKISNNFIENSIQNSNATTLKTIYYLATILENLELDNYQNDDLLDITIDTKDMLQYTNMTASNITKNLKSMQKTSITFINEFQDWSMGVSLLPFYKTIFGKNKTELKVFVQIAKLIIDVKRNYTMIDIQSIMKFKSKHTLRILPLLTKILAYNKNSSFIDDSGEMREKQMVIKHKHYTLDMLNDFFGTAYKKLSQFELFVLRKVKKDLMYSDITFDYSMNFEFSTNKGRPKAKSITITPIDLKELEYTLYNRYGINKIK